MIDDEQFLAWRKKDAVTQEVFKAMTKLREGIGEALQSADVIMHPNGHLLQARLLGQREGLDVFLNIHLGDLTDEDPSSGT